MKTIEQDLSTLYNSVQVAILLNDIQNLITGYQDKNIAGNHEKLSEKDVVIITYGNQVYKKGEAKLLTLKKLLNEHVGNEISIVHILPFYPSSSDDGFSVIDYYKVNPEMGSWADIESLSKDYILIFDAVINHNSSQSGWFKKFLLNEPKYNDFYIELNDTKGYEHVVRPRTSPLIHTFDSIDGTKTVWTTFSRDQVDLNFRNPAVFFEIMNLLLFYVSEGARIIRLDAVGFMWKEKGSSCLHLSQTHTLIQVMRKVIEKVDSRVLLLTETNVPHLENISYFGNDNEANMVYNFTLPPLLLYSLLNQDDSKLTAWAGALEVPFPDVCFFNFLASHDGIGLRPVDNILSDTEISVLVDAAVANGGRVSYKSNPDGKETPYEINCNFLSLLKGKNCNIKTGIKKLILAHAVLLAMPGLPAIYFHSLFGSENDMEGMMASGINRRINREKLEYNSLTKSIKNISGKRHKILSAMKKMMQARKKQSAFNPYAPFQINSPGNGVFNITRVSQDGKEEIRTYFNFTDVRKRVVINDKELYRNLLEPESIENNFNLLPLGFKWLKKHR